MRRQLVRLLAEFDSLWAALKPREQVDALKLLIERVDYDGRQGSVEISFLPTGIMTLAGETAPHEETAA